MKIKIDQADKVFSQAIRCRDRECVRCHSPVRFNDKELPVSHQASHFFGRGQETTRFDPENVDTLCMACHRYWGSDHREDYRNFKIKQLGQSGFDFLILRAKVPRAGKKKDRKLELIKAKELLKKYK